MANLHDSILLALRPPCLRYRWRWYARVIWRNIWPKRLPGNHCNTLRQQIALLCVHSCDKSYAQIAAIVCSDKSPGVNVNNTIFHWVIYILSPRKNFVPSTCRTKSPSLILCGMLHRQNSVEATKFSIKFSCSHDETCCCDVCQRFVGSCIPASKRASCRKSAEAC